MTRPRILLLLALVASIPSLAAAANPASIKVSFTKVAGVDNVSALTKSGRVFAGKTKGSKITITIPSKSVANTSFFASYQGKQIGPLFAVKGSKGTLVLNKSLKDPISKKALSSLNLKLKAVSSNDAYVTIKNPLAGIFNSKYSYTPSGTKSLGLNLPGSTSIRAAKQAPGDSDGDGVMDSLDVDIDGDGITNLADSDTVVSSGGRPSILAGEGNGNGGGNGGGNNDSESDTPDAPYTSMYLSVSDTVNWHINGALSTAQIDATVGGANVFAMAFYTNLSGPDAAGITGGHLVCSESTEYCKPSGGSAVYSGFSDGDQSLPGRFWSSITTDGSPYSFERMTSNGGSSDEIVLAGSLQPRVGTDRFFPGQSFRLDFTNARSAVVLSKNLTLPLYFMTTPAIKSFGTTATSSEDVAIDYSAQSLPGTSDLPIVLATTGEFAGKLRLKAWRLQRLSVRPEETGLDYRDYGNLNYGVIITNQSGEFTCGGLYSELSSSLTEGTSTGTDGSFSPSQGAVLWPLVDGSADYEPSNEASLESSNIIQFTVDLKSCLGRNGLSAGTHRVTLMAAGASFRNGANRAGQTFSVTIP